MSKQKIINAIRKEIGSCKKELAGHTVFLFGSRATNTAKERSDFDIGVIGKKALSQKTFSMLEERLESIPTLHSIDLVDFTHVSKSFRQEALKKTLQLYP